LLTAIVFGPGELLASSTTGSESVEIGTMRLTSPQRRAASAWVLSFFDMVSPGRGIAPAHFLSLAVGRSQVGKTRSHPRIELSADENLAAPEANGHFVFGRTYRPALKVCGVWIAADGDDSGSTFKAPLTPLDLAYDSP